MNELQKEYFRKQEQERAEAEAAEEARAKAFMEGERKKEAVKKEMEAKAKEEADRKAEAEAQEIIDRVKANIAKEKAEKATTSEKKDGKASAAKGKQEDKPEAKRKEAPAKETPVKEEAEKEAKTADKASEKTEDDNIYEREPVGEASMPKKSPKFKKGAHKKPATANVTQASKEAAATKEPEAEAAQEKQPEKKKSQEAKPKSQESEVKSKKPEQAVEEQTTEETTVEEETAEEPTEKATPQSKAASDKEAKLQELADEYQDKYKRLLAEFENARAREAKEASRMYDVGAKAVLEKLLPVVDNFERAIQAIPEEDKDRAFEQGVDKIYKQLMTILGDIGVAPMNAEGTEFNPDLHNAVMHVEDDAYGENIVAEEMQKGYMYKESVLRYSMVKVAN